MLTASIQIVQVQVTFEVPDTGDLTDNALEHLPAAARIARDALQHFLALARVYRWQPWLGLSGEPPQFVGPTTVIQEASGERVPAGWSAPLGTVRLSDEAALSSDDVAHLARAVDAGEEPDLAGTLLADSEELLAQAENTEACRRPILLGAIACEVKVKTTLRRKALPESQALLALILENPRDWSLAAQALFDKGVEAVCGRSLRVDDVELYKAVGELFTMRNRIAHKGEVPDSVPQSRHLIRAIRRAFDWLDSL